LIILFDLILFENTKELNQSDLILYNSGYEDCVPGHSVGPDVRNFFLIHYIHSGSGIFQVGDSVYNLGKNQGFLIYPNVLCNYQADLKDPWSYSWVAFTGYKAESYLKQAGFSLHNLIFRYDRDNFLKDCFNQILEAKSYVKTKEIRCTGLLSLFLAQLIEANCTEVSVIDSYNNHERYIKEVVKFIHMNYSSDITMEDISKHIGLHKNYIGTMFKSQLNISPQKYILNLRMSKACDLIKNSSQSIGDIAHSVGYSDSMLFSKMFKKVKGMPPNKYRKYNNIQG
jgi:AraC-like DNA-binding protein